MGRKKMEIVPVGITENCDPAYYMELFDNLYDANIIITKNLITEELIEKLIEHKDKIILHVTCTGMGHTLVEPCTASKETVHVYFKKLIDAGFPIEQTVLRIDPCIPTEKGIKTAISVIELFSDTGIKRVRFSSLDMYNHVKNRFIEERIPIPYKTFHASDDDIMKLYHALKEVTDKYGMTLECCAEPLVDSVSCLSQKDIDILGLSDKITLVGNIGQRKNCNCPKNKTSLVKGIKPKQCPNKCAYCFWKN